MTPAAQARVTALVTRLDEVIAENRHLKRQLQEHELLAVPVPAIGRLIGAAAAEFGVTYRAILAHDRLRELALPRQVVMYLAATRLHRSLPLIGRCLDRDHTTVMHGRDRIAALVATDPELAARVDRVAAAAIQPREFAA